ncbi:hypothetical protein V6N13_071604 [Hibiscus sabdariffa]
MRLVEHNSWTERVARANSISNLFPKMQDIHHKSLKKYASMMELQDKAFSKLEKKRRDRGIKRNKRTGKENENLKVDGASPTNSAIVRKKSLPDLLGE